MSVLLSPLSAQAAVDPDRVTPGTLGFLVVVAMGVATWLLLRSLTRHLGRVDFEEEPAGEDVGDARPAAAADGEPPSDPGRPSG